MEGRDDARVEAANHQGSVELPAPLGRTVILLGLTLVASIALTVWLETAGSTSYIGHLQSHVTELTIPEDAVLSRWIIKEGDQVEPGKQIAVLVDDKVAGRLAGLRADAASLQAELAQKQSQAEIDLAWRMESIDKEILDTKLKVAGFLKEQYDQQMQQKGLERLIGGAEEDDIFDGQVVAASASSFAPTNENSLQMLLRKESAKNAEQVAQVQLKLCERRIDQLSALKTELPAKIGSALGLDVATAELQAIQIEIARLEQVQAEQPLTANAHGIVGLFRKQPGDRITAGDTLVEILDTDRTFLSVRIPSRDLPSIAAESELALEFPGGDDRKGKVRAIPPQTDRSQSSGDADVEIFVDQTDRLWPTVPVGSEVIVRTAK